ncbi:MAG: DUF3048 domain-containing protein [Anaerolineae bacterium]|nr:DUF3048 domain-containing protein [Anaerolineae bacterium]
MVLKKWLLPGIILLLPALVSCLSIDLFQGNDTIPAVQDKAAQLLPTEEPFPVNNTHSPETFTSSEKILTPTTYPSPIPPPGGFTQSVLGLEGITSEINPLTGLSVDELWRLERHPVMVKVSNSLNVRPQSGLSFADIVFEYYIGEGINRFLAVFYSQDVPQAGPIRSGRMVDAQLVSMYRGILAYGSADPRVDEILKRELGDRAISHLEIGCPVICGQDTHANPGVYGNTFELTQYSRKLGLDEKRQELHGFFFDPAPPSQNEYAVQVGIQYAKFNRGEWRYDPETKTYNRWTDDKGDSTNMIPLTDRLTGDQVTAANVIILFVEYVEFNPTLHNIKVWDNQEGQRALFFRDGVLINGSWRAPGHHQPIQFYNDFGLPMALKPGKSWITLVGNSSTFDTIGPGAWELRFRLP